VAKIGCYGFKGFDYLGWANWGPFPVTAVLIIAVFLLCFGAGEAGLRAPHNRGGAEKTEMRQDYESNCLGKHET
jgi:hypothetical protein